MGIGYVNENTHVFSVASNHHHHHRLHVLTRLASATRLQCSSIASFIFITSIGTVLISLTLTESQIGLQMHGHDMKPMIAIVCARCRR